MVLIIKSLGKVETSPNNEAKVQLAKYCFLSQRKGKQYNAATNKT